MKDYQKLIKNGDYQEVIDELIIVLSSDSYNTEALIWLAKAQFKLELYFDAIDNYNKLINLIPGMADLYADRGLCYHLAGEVKLALEDFNKAVELEPENAYRYSSRAFVKDYYKDYQGALKDYNKALEIDPKDAITHNNKGVLEEKLGFEDQAQESFKTHDQLQGIDLDKELAKINSSNTLAITRAKPIQKKLSLNSYFLVLKSIFTTKNVLKEFANFLIGKGKRN